MRKIRYYIVIIVGLFVASCEEVAFLKLGEKDDPIAVVGESSLYMEDLKNISFQGMTASDSVEFLKAHVNKWVVTQLKKEKSHQLMTEQELEDIERKIEDYRNSLLTFSYERALAAEVDTLVTEAQLNDYYNENRSKYRLIGPVVKAKIVAYPKSYKQKVKLKKIVVSNDEDAYYDLVDMSKKGDLEFYDYTKEWFYFKDILQKIPFSDNKVDELLKRDKFWDIADEEVNYMVSIQHYLLTGDYVPQEMVEGRLKSAIINGRRKDFIEQMEDTLLINSINSGYTKINIVDSTIILVDSTLNKIDSLDIE